MQAIRLTHDFFQITPCDVSMTFHLIWVLMNGDVTLYEENVINFVFGPETIVRHVVGAVVDTGQEVKCFDWHLMINAMDVSN